MPLVRAAACVCGELGSGLPGSAEGSAGRRDPDPDPDPDPSGSGAAGTASSRPTPNQGPPANLCLLAASREGRALGGED